MFPRGEIKRNLLGTLEVFLFMKQGIERFGDSKGEMLRSWLIIPIGAPFMFFHLMYTAPDRPELAHFSTPELFGLFFVKDILATVLILGILYAFARQYKRESRFFRIITISNWSGIVTIILNIPLLIGLSLDHYDFNDVYPIGVVIAVYGYFNAAFALTHTLRIPWELGGFLAIFCLAVNQTSLDLLIWAIN